MPERPVRRPLEELAADGAHLLPAFLDERDFPVLGRPAPYCEPFFTTSARTTCASNGPHGRTLSSVEPHDVTTRRAR